MDLDSGSENKDEGASSFSPSHRDLDEAVVSVLARMPMPAWAINHNCDLIYVNPEWHQFTGRCVDQECGEGWLAGVLPEDRTGLRHACHDALAHKRPFTMEFQLRRADGQYRWLTCFATPVTLDDGATQGVVGMCMDLTDRRQREEQLAYMATHDALTGLPNRRMLQETLDRAVNRARRGEPGALLLLDMDNLKSYNDARGHLEGDQAIINFSLVLQRHLRGGDLLARIGGDEFVVLLERTSLKEAIVIAERMRLAARESFVADAGLYELGMSAGLVPIDGSLDGNALIDVADTALYEAKNSGRNRVVVREEASLETDSREEHLLARVRAALSEKRFRLYYQPVVRLSDQKVVYFESLSRMIDSDGSVLVPGEYLTAVERSGLMPRLTRVNIAMLLQALTDHAEAVVSLNVSSADLADDSLPRFIEEELRRRNIAPDRLVFEMSEGAVVANLASARYWMQRLRGIGGRFVLDDFGAGLGLFNLLRDLDFEQVKLDGSIVRAMHADGDSMQFVSAVRSLVESQGRVAVASWVETEGLLQSVQEAGFSLGQGYHIEMPDPDLGRLLEIYDVVTRRAG
jgi:diguanylate cyclase (GGDEF)-like protein/PAS domain S-box-containing protein